MKGLVTIIMMFLGPILLAQNPQPNQPSPKPQIGILKYNARTYQGRPIRTGVLMTDSVYKAIQTELGDLQNDLDIFRQAYDNQEAKIEGLKEKTNLQSIRITDLETSNTAVRLRLQESTKTISYQNEQLGIYRKKFYEFTLLNKEIRIHKWSVNIGVPLVVVGTLAYMSR